MGFQWGSGRSLVEGPFGEPVESSSIVLAAQRTQRKDPLNGFKRYTGGWNISDHHYWAVSSSLFLKNFAFCFSSSKYMKKAEF